MSTEIQNLRMEVEALKRKTIPLCTGLAEEYANVQQRTDAAYRAVGRDGAPAALQGEGLRDYQLRLLDGLKAKSPAWRNVTLPRAQDALAAIEPIIIRDAVSSLTDSSNYAPGELKAVASLDQTGRKITRFYGDPSACWAPFQPAGMKYVTGFGGGK